MNTKGFLLVVFLVKLQEGNGYGQFQESILEGIKNPPFPKIFHFDIICYITFYCFLMIVILYLVLY